LNTQNIYNIKINFHGGIAPVGLLDSILNMEGAAYMSGVRIGTRQEIMFQIPFNFFQTLQPILDAAHADYEVNANEFPNIVSSYTGTDIFHSGTWLTEGGYLDILSQFTHRPRLKVNIADNNQTFTPFFTGHLNFIASAQPNFWYCYIRFPKNNALFCWDTLLYSTDIPRFCEEIEKVILKENVSSQAELEAKCTKNAFLTSKITEPLTLPRFVLPYYEGINQYGDRSWIGIYRRNEFFYPDFLRELCKLCKNTQIAQVGITPWRSLIVKGVENKDRLRWERLLGHYGINLRHAAFELNWQHNGSEEDIALKNDLVEQFNNSDARTSGVCFALKTQAKTEVFGSIVIKKMRYIGGLMSLYRVSYKENFNPNSRINYIFEEKVTQAALPRVLLQLYKKYQVFLRESSVATHPTHIIPTKSIQNTETTTKIVHQCPNCKTIYDAEFGDATQNIAPGIPFEALSSVYECSVCATNKSEFVSITI
jgi:rubredoxin